MGVKHQVTYILLFKKYYREKDQILKLNPTVIFMFILCTEQNTYYLISEHTTSTETRCSKGKICRNHQNHTPSHMHLNSFGMNLVQKQELPTGFQQTIHTHLGNGDGLLFHDFVDGCAVTVYHFVKLVDAAHSTIGQH